MTKSTLIALLASGALTVLISSPASAANCGALGEASFWSCETSIHLKSIKGNDATRLGANLARSAAKADATGGNNSGGGDGGNDGGGNDGGTGNNGGNGGTGGSGGGGDDDGTAGAP